MSGRDGPSLVLLPGMHGTAALFQPLRRHLPGVSVHTIEYPGEPMTDYHALTTMVGQALPDEDIVILGESFGGPMAVTLAATRPRVRGLILASSFLRAPLAPALRVLARWLAPPILRLPPPRWAITRYLLGRDAAPALVASVVEEVQKVRPGVLAARLRALLAVDVRTPYAALAIPALLVVGGRDRLVSASFRDETLRARPDATVLTLPDAPHLTLQTGAAEVATSVLAFLPRCHAPRAVSR